MSQVDLRPLSMGELLDRTFSLYRRHFPLFIGIAAIPHLLVLALQRAQLQLQSVLRFTGKLFWRFASELCLNL